MRVADEDDGVVHAASLRAAREVVVDSPSLEDGGITPLVWASSEGIPHAARALLNAGASVGIGVCVQAALSRGHAATAAVILGHRRCEWLMMLAQGRPSFLEPAHTRRALLSCVATLVAADSKLVARQLTRAATRRGVPDALLVCMEAVQQAKSRASRLREREPSSADDVTSLSTQLELSAAAVLALQCGSTENVDRTLRSVRIRTHAARRHNPSQLPTPTHAARRRSPSLAQ